MVYDKGRLVRGGNGEGGVRVSDVKGEWGDDYVGFLIGCSFGFEGVLAAGGLVPRHWETGRTVPMYKTNVPLNPAGGAYLSSSNSYLLIFSFHRFE